MQSNYDNFISIIVLELFKRYLKIKYHYEFCIFVKYFLRIKENFKNDSILLMLIQISGLNLFYHFSSNELYCSKFHQFLVYYFEIFFKQFWQNYTLNLIFVFLLLISKNLLFYLQHYSKLKIPKSIQITY